MEYISLFLDFIRHIDVYLGQVVDQHGMLVYAIIAVIIFCEVGLVVTPFLPGDSMLFAIGAMCANGTMDLSLVLMAFPIAAVCGDNCNRFIGSKIGHRAFAKGTGKIFNAKNYTTTRKFFRRFGPKAVTIGRFMPFFRAFVPFVAGMSGMRFRTFLPWSILGGAGWVFLCTLTGYFFGNIHVVKNNFEFVVIGVIFVSAIPAIMGFIRQRRKSRSVAA